MSKWSISLAVLVITATSSTRSPAEMVFSDGKLFQPSALLAEVKGQFGWR